MLLDRLRQSVAGWMAKALIALLVVSFALWGIGDVFGRSPDPAIAEIGDEDISVSQFQRFFVLAFNQLQQRAREQGQELDIASARKLGLDQQVLNALINRSVLEQSAEALGLRISDEALIQDIQNDPIFHGPFGSFDRIHFEQTLQNINLPEADYIADRRHEHLRIQLSTIFSARPTPPSLLVNHIYKAQNERRAAEYVILNPAALPQPKVPNDDALKKFIRDNPGLFIKEEHRRFSIFILEPKDFLSSIKISYKRVKQEYDARLAQFKTPEQRLVQQITFPDKKAAQKARRNINRGTPFSKIAKAQKFSQEDISLGWLTEGEYLSPDFEKAAKKLRKGDVSQVLNGPLGPVLLHVQDIKPARQKSFGQVQKNLRRRLVLDKARDEIYAIHNLIEDERASGEKLSNIAKKFPGRFFKSGSLKAKDRPPKKMPEIEGLLDRVFSSAQGEELSVARTEQDGYYWLDVTDIIPPEKQTLSDARAKAIVLWRKKERRKKIAEMAEKIVQRGSLGASFKSLTKFPIKATPPLARFAKSDVLPSDLIEALFRAPRGAFIQGAGMKPGEIVVLRLGRITSAQDGIKAQKALKERIRSEITQLSANELIEQYIARAKNQYGLAIYDDNIQLAFDTLTQNF